MPLALRSAAVVYSGGGTECERTCAFFLPFYLPAEGIFRVYQRGAFPQLLQRAGPPGYLGALLASLGVPQWVGISRIRARGVGVRLPSIVKTLAELDRAGRYTVRGEEIALADVPEEEVKTETVSFTVQSLRLDAVTAGLFRNSPARPPRSSFVSAACRSTMCRACTRTPPSATATLFPCAARARERSPTSAAARKRHRYLRHRRTAGLKI